MVTNEQITLYRNAVLKLLLRYRQGIYADSGFKKFPSDQDLAMRLGISKTAMSSIFRCCSSMSGITLRSLFVDLSHLYSEPDFLGMFSDFILD